MKKTKIYIKWGAKHPESWHIYTALYNDIKTRFKQITQETRHRHMRFEFKSINIPAATIVANEFIDKYMSKANGEYIKIYLYILRHADKDVNVADIADDLDMLEADVRRGIAYWSRQQLICQIADEDSEVLVQSIDKPKDNIVYIAEAQNKEVVREKSTIYDPDNRPRADIAKLDGDDNFSELTYIVQKLWGVVLKPTDVERIAYLYDNLSMSKDLLEYLAEYCATYNKKSTRYFEKVALDWHSKGILTVEKAKQEGSIYTKEVYNVFKIFGIGRAATPVEAEIILKWYKTYMFSDNIIEEACKRTILTAHKPDFKYADKILAAWSKAGVRTLEDIKRLDSEHKKEGTIIAAKPKQPNRFHNMEERDDDVDARALEKMQEMLKQYN